MGKLIKPDMHENHKKTRASFTYLFLQFNTAQENSETSQFPGEMCQFPRAHNLANNSAYTPSASILFIPTVIYRYIMVGTRTPVGRFRYIQHINKGTPVGRSVPQNLLSWGYLSVPNLLTRSSARIPAYYSSCTIYF